MRRANRAKNDIFIALTRIGVGPGVNMESHNDVATEVMMKGPMFTSKHVENQILEISQESRFPCPKPDGDCIYSDQRVGKS
jgi:hypothetical protein